MTQRVIIKLGGATLFREGGFSEDLLPLLNRFENDQVLVMVGGGEIVEAMRSAHRFYPMLDPEGIHWRCVELLEHSLAIAREVMPLGGCVASPDEWIALVQQEAVRDKRWLSVASFYSPQMHSQLPKSWQPKLNWNTTTDALAWLAGKIFKANRVVLMKQCKVDRCWSLQHAAELGIVDPEIARLASENSDEMIIELV
jgi:aspartokinase-like uncharacterized kinase